MWVILKAGAETTESSGYLIGLFGTEAEAVEYGRLMFKKRRPSWKPGPRDNGWYVNPDGDPIFKAVRITVPEPTITRHAGLLEPAFAI